MLQEEDDDGKQSQKVIEDDDDEEKREAKKWQEILAEGKFNLIPGFFKLLVFLKKTKRDFSLVFRTFGEDLPDIIWEFNKFCSG